MPAQIIDVLNALETLAWRHSDATVDDVAAELVTSRDDVVPQLMEAYRSGLVETAKRPDGSSVFGLTRRGERVLADAQQSASGGYGK